MQKLLEFLTGFAQTKHIRPHALLVTKLKIDLPLFLKGDRILKTVFKSV